MKFLERRWTFPLDAEERSLVIESWCYEIGREKGFVSSYDGDDILAVSASFLVLEPILVLDMGNFLPMTQL